VALVVIRGKPFSVCLSTGKVTVNIKSRKCDPRHIRQFGRLQNHSNFEHFGFLCRKNKKLKIPSGKGNFGIMSTAKILFRIVYKLHGRLRFFSSIKDVRMLKSPLFLKSSLNLAKFDGKFIGICKHLLSVVWLRSLHFS